MDAWGRYDPKAAQAWTKLQDSNYGQDSLVAVATQWASILEDESGKATVFLSLGTEWGISDPSVALGWIGGIEDEKFRQNAEAGAPPDRLNMIPAPRWIGR